MSPPAPAVLLLVVSLLSSGASARSITVKNSCAFTIWPALFTDLNAGPNVPAQATGWEAAPGSTVTFDVPDNWTAGRIWGRKDCDFTTNPGPNSCSNGGCNGGLLCDPHTGTGVPPASVAEFTLSGQGGVDWYDVSLVDGFNLPIQIDPDPRTNCPVASCAVDLGATCPDALKSPGGGCKSACTANLDGNPANSPNCCSGQYSTPESCPSDKIEYHSFFTDACPTAYAAAYDDKTALFTCGANLGAAYTVTFCPAS